MLYQGSVELFGLITSGTLPIKNVQFFKGMEMTVNLPPPEQLRFSFESCCLGNK